MYLDLTDWNHPCLEHVLFLIPCSRYKLRTKVDSAEKCPFKELHGTIHVHIPHGKVLGTRTKIDDAQHLYAMVVSYAPIVQVSDDIERRVD
jgi:hypothetical protein